MKKFIGGVIIGTALGCLIQPHLNSKFLSGKCKCHIDKNCKQMHKKYRRMKKTAFRTYKDLKSYIME